MEVAGRGLMLGVCWKEGRVRVSQASVLEQGRDLVLVPGDASQGAQRAFEKLTWNRHILHHLKHRFVKHKPSPTARK